MTPHARLRAALLLPVTLLLLAALPLVLVAPAASVAQDAAGVVGDTLFDIPELPTEFDAPDQRSVIYAADGSVLAVLHGVENRTLVSLDDVPDHLVDAVIATEDQHFWDHNGVYAPAVARALRSNLTSGDVSQGGSTITQQYVKQVLLSPEQTLQRKVREAAYAVELEKRLTKEQILEGYLNEVYLGEGVYGVGTAAEHYFGTTVDQITVGQAAMFAGMIRAPERNDPVDNPEAARQRRDIVLGQMLSAGMIDTDTHDRAVAADLDIDVHPLPEPTQPFFVEWVKQQLFDDPRLGQTRQDRVSAVLRGGLRIRTSIDPDRQKTAEQALATYLDDPLADPMGALVSVEPDSGKVVAMAVGPKAFGQCSDDHDGTCPHTKVNPAVPGGGGSGRQAGSVFKAVVDAAALTDGFTTDWSTSTASNQPVPGCLDGTRPWTPSNYGGGGGGYRDMVNAVRTSNNVYHAKLTGQLGPHKVARMAGRLGLGSDVLADIAELDADKAKYRCAIALGVVDTFPLEMASAYATFANGGVRCEPYTITSVADADGDVRFRDRPECDRALDADVAADMNALLAGPPSTSGTARAAILDRPQGGKTGTTDDWKDAWFAGYVPQLATVAWVGYEQPRPMTGLQLGGTYWSRITGGSVPARMWHDFMAPSVADLEPVGFPPGSDDTEIGAPVPDVVGLTQPEGSLRVAAVDLIPDIITVHDWRPEGLILHQDVPAGTSATFGRTVVLHVSDGDGPYPQLPDVTGEPVQHAERRLRDAGWPVTTTEQDTLDQRLDGVVLSMTPEQGTRVRPGGPIEVTLVVGRFSPPPPTLGPPGDVQKPDPSDEPSDDPANDPSDGPSPSPGADADRPGREPTPDDTPSGPIPGPAP